MNSPTRQKPLRNADFPCADFTTMAERELTAFFTAVTQIFGSEQAELSAEYWLQELIEIDELPASAREWRRITATVSTRLGRSLSTDLQTV